MMLFTITLDSYKTKKVVLYSIIYVISNNYARIKIDSNDSLPLEKTLTFHNVIILIKSVFNKEINNCYHNIFLEKCSYK